LYLDYALSEPVVEESSGLTTLDSISRKISESH
jgi:hypothetical protein